MPSGDRADDVLPRSHAVALARSAERARTLVLGATGFIGANVARDLLAAGYHVRGLRRASSDLRAVDGVADRIEWATGDLYDRASLVDAMRGMDSVVHAAAYYPVSGLDVGESMRRAATQMRNVLAAAREARVRRLVYTSSLTTIGPSKEPGRLADERDRYLPGSIPSAYCEAKWAMELEALAAVGRGLDVVIVNPTIVLGPWDAKPTSGRLVTVVANGQLPFFVQAKVNVVDARDVAAGHRLALEKGSSGERYLLGNENVWMSELFQSIAREAGSHPPMADVPIRAVRAVSYATELAAKAGFEASKRLAPFAPAAAALLKRPPALPLEAVDVLAHAQPLNPAKARSELGMPSRPLAETIRDTIAWFRERGYVRA